MAGRARLIQTNMGGGELSRAARARPDTDIYGGGLEICFNNTVRPAGAMDRRPGFVRAGTAQTATAGRLFSLVKAINDVVRIEAGGGKFRFWNAATRALILNAGVPVEVVVPWTDAELPGLRFWQQGDVMWFAHVSHLHATYALRRTAANAFSLDPVEYTEGPFLESQKGQPSLTFSGATGSVTVTAAASVFNAAHVGALIRCEAETGTGWSNWTFDVPVELNDVVRNGNRIYTCTGRSDPFKTGNAPPIHESGAQWDGSERDNIQWEFAGYTYGLLEITAYTSPTQVTASVLRRLPFYGAMTMTTNFWQLSAISAAEGYPACGAIVEERQAVFGTTRAPDRCFLGRSLQYAPTDFDMRPGFVTETVDTDAVRKSLAEGRTAEISWALMMDQLMLGTTQGVRTLSGPSADEPLTPAGTVPRTVTEIPCSSVVPGTKADNAILYLAPGEEELIEISRDPQAVPRNLLEMADHMAGGGLRCLTWLGRPRRQLWAIDRRGRLVSLTYSPENGTIAWSRHRLGGLFGRRQPIVEWCDSAPGPDGRDELWAIVKRTVNGATVRSIEWMERPFDTDTMRLEDCCCLDAAGFFNTSQSYTVLAAFDGTYVTLTAQGGATPFTNADFGREFWLTANEDLPDEEDEPAPIRIQIVQQVSSTLLRGQMVGQYPQGAWLNRVLRVARPAKSLSVPWLVGEQVLLNADGRTIGPLTVPVGGTLDLVSEASPDGILWVGRGWVGLSYKSLARTLPVNGGEGLGTSRTATGRVTGIGILPDAVGEGVVRRADQSASIDSIPINPRQANAVLGQAAPPLTDDKFIPLDTGFDRRKQVEIISEGALPCSVAGFMLKVESYG